MALLIPTIQSPTCRRSAVNRADILFGCDYPTSAVTPGNRIGEGNITHAHVTQSEVSSDNVGAQPQTNANTVPKSRPVPVAPVDPLELMEPDHYGAELSKDAKVWKVYVKEADQRDTELVDGWNKSLDVILVFAALFSAVSTAFLIESSDMLREDPNNVSAATLVEISQALKILVHISLDGSSPTDAIPYANPIPDFTPSQPAVVVNTLWYLSLSLSIATSLLAMLAKDWCRSFLANRTGHPWDQALRRQRRWMMLERWKMQELITVLPSLIHLSLLLFAIGLSIYVWEINSTAAIPVITVSGLSLAFYIWSSVMAISVKFFPYTTIFSRALRSDFIRGRYQHSVRLITRATSWLPLVAVYPLLLLLLALLLLVAILCLPILAMDFLRLRVPPNAQFKDKYLESGHYFKALSTGCRLILDHAGNKLGCQVITRFLPLNKEDLDSFYPRTQNLYRARELEEDKGRATVREGDDQNWIISFALKWLIQNCETPSSVAIALQSIAGASPRIPLEPLESCHATLKILQRLVSSSPTNELESEIKLYSRALAVLRTQAKSSRLTQEDDNTVDTEVAIWDLKSDHERRMVDLVKNMEFLPNKDNIEALNIGNMAASLSLRLIKGDDQPASKALSSIVGLLSDHVSSGNIKFSPAALQALSHAAVLLASCQAGYSLRSTLVEICMNQATIKLTDFDKPSETKDTLDPQTVLLICTLLHGRREAQESVYQSHLVISSRVERAANILTNNCLRSPASQFRFYLTGLLEILYNPDKYGMTSNLLNQPNYLRYKEKVYDAYLRSCAPYLHAAIEHEGYDVEPSGNAYNKVPELPRTINQVYELVMSANRHTGIAVGLPAPIYCSLIWATFLAESTDELDMCGKLLSGTSFLRKNDYLVPEMQPTLSHLWHIYGCQLASSEPINTMLPHRPNAAQPKLRTKSDVASTVSPQSRHFAATQLWLSLLLADDLSIAPIHRQNEDAGDHSETATRTQRPRANPVKLRLEADIIQSYEEGHGLGIYSERVIECILDGRKLEKKMKMLLNNIKDALKDVPESLRGLSSFLSSSIVTDPEPMPTNVVPPGSPGSSVIRPLITELPPSSMSISSTPSEYELGVVVVS